MGKRTLQIDVIGPVKGTDLVKCKLYADGRVCAFWWKNRFILPP